MLKKENLKDIYPLSSMQAGLLFHHMYDDSSSAYFNQYAFRLSEDLDPLAFEQAFQKIVERHDVLRTVFVYKNVPEPLQVILKKQAVAFQYIDLRQLNLPSEADKINYLKQFKQDDLDKSFDLSKGPLIRLSLLQIDANRVDMVWSNHHIIVDGWGAGILLKDLFAFYYAFKQGKTLTLKPAVSHKAYINWLQQQDTQLAVNYWQQYLADYQQTSSLKSTLSSEQEDAFSLCEFAFNFSAESSQALNRFATQEKLTLSTVLQSLWGILLGQYSGKNDCVFGAVVSGRPDEVVGIEAMAGLCMNTVPVRIHWSANESLSTVLQRVQNDALAAKPYHYYPLVEIQTQTPLKQHLFDHIIDFENYPLDEELQNTFAEFTQGISFDTVEEVDHAHYDFTIIVQPRAKIKFLFLYNENVFNEQFMQQVANNFIKMAAKLATAMTQKHSIQVADLTQGLISQAQFADINPFPLEYPRNKTIVDLFEQQVEQTPEHTALVCEGRGLSYRELNNAANQVAHYLHNNYTITADNRIGIVMTRSEWMLIGIWGILKAGGAYVPMEPDYPNSHIQQIVQDSQCVLILSDAALITQLNAIPFALPLLEIQTLTGATHNPAFALDPRQLAYIIYTSGSTGRPKGVMIEHGSLVSLVHALEPVIYQQLPKPLNEAMASAFVFDLSVKQLFSTLVRGNTLFVMTGDIRLDPSLFTKYLHQHAIQLIDVSPSFFTAMLDLGFAQHLPPNLQHIIIGSESVPPDLIERFYQYPNTQHISMTDMYGPTENCAEATYYPLDSTFQNTGLAAVPIGRPIPNTEVLLLDDKHQVVPIGVAGQLCLSSPGLARGYLGDATLSAEKFIPHPFRAGQRLYLSGDLGRWRMDGQIEYLGRNDDQVKIRGFRIELGEVEKRLRQHNEVKEVVVLVKNINDSDELVAYFVGTAEPEQLRAHIKNNAPHYMVPAFLIALDKLPLNLSSKIDKKALLKRPITIVEPETISAANTTGYSQLETQLLALWETVLGRKGIGIHDNFFDLGGHSIKATKLIVQIQKHLKVETKLRDLFVAPTIAGLAKIIASSQQEKSTAITAIPTADHYALSYAQRRLWLMDQTANRTMNYNIHDALLLTGALNREALQQALYALCNRHEILRTAFTTVNGEPRQRILPATCYRNLNFVLDQGNSSQLIQQEAQYQFDLSNAPLLRTLLIQHDSTRHTLVFTIHHIISDGWSIDILLKELASLYNSYNLLQATQLPPLKIQYKDYAAWQNQFLAGDMAATLKHYWRTKMALPLPVLKLATDHPRPVLKTYSSAVLIHDLDRTLTQALHNLSSQYKVSLFMLIVSAVRGLLYRYTGQTDSIIGTALSGRHHVDLENQMGFYVNLLPLRTQLQPQANFLAALYAEKETVLGAYEHQAYPFDKLVNICSAGQDRSRFPLFDVVVDLQDEEQLDTQVFHNLSLQLAGKEPDSSEYDVAWLCINKGEQLSLHLTYNTDLFSKSTMQDWITHLERIFIAITQDIEVSLGDIPLHNNAVSMEKAEQNNDLDTAFDF